MSLLGTTRLSSKGQVVIPEEIRERLGLSPGVRFIVVGDRHVVMLKAISTPSMRDFDGLIAKIRKQARKAGLMPRDVKSVIAKVRRNM